MSILNYPLGLVRHQPYSKRAMDSILQGLPKVICYLDDILITGTSEEEHIRNVEEVLQRLKENGVKLHRDKCCKIQLNTLV